MEDLLIGLLVVGIIMFVVQIVLIVKIISASDNIDRIYHLLYDALQKRTDNTMHKEVSPAPQQTYVQPFTTDEEEESSLAGMDCYRLHSSDIYFTIAIIHGCYACRCYPGCYILNVRFRGNY